MSSTRPFRSTCMTLLLLPSLPKSWDGLTRRASKTEDSVASGAECKMVAARILVSGRKSGRGMIDMGILTVASEI